MRQLSCILIFALLFGLLSGCSPEAPAQIAATTLPVYEFTAYLCQDTGISVTRLVTENISCLHDYSLQVNQMRAIEGAELIVISGAGLEEFLEDVLSGKDNIIDASYGIELLCGGHEHEHDADHGHSHENDPHIWLSVENARRMAHNIYAGLSAAYPEKEDIFTSNLTALDKKFEALDSYGQSALSDLTCRDMITFHDGFSYLAAYFDLHILKAVEEESGSEASAAELTELITMVHAHALPAIFTEVNGSASAAGIISAEADVSVFSLDMAMGSNSYFEAMYRNIDTIKEALG